MRYLLLIYVDPRCGLDGAEAGKAMNEGVPRLHGLAARQRAATRPARRSRTSTATTVHVRDGQPITTDGPFAETKEQLGGYYLIEAADLDEANRRRPPGSPLRASARSRSGRSQEPAGRRRQTRGRRPRRRSPRASSARSTAGARHPHPGPGRLRPRRGGRRRTPSPWRWSAGRVTASPTTRGPGSRRRPATARSTGCAARGGSRTSAGPIVRDAAASRTARPTRFTAAEDDVNRSTTTGCG